MIQLRASRVVVTAILGRGISLFDTRKNQPEILEASFLLYEPE